jgi:hypothetical protein
MKLSCLSPLSRQPKANRQRHPWSFILRLSRLTSHVLLLTLLFVLLALAFAGPAFSQQTWWRTYGGTVGDWGESVQQTTDGGYIVAGVTTSFGAGSFDVYLIKTNAQGDTLWTRTFGGEGGDGGSSVQQTSDGGYIIAGRTFSFGAGSYDVYLIKTNAFGDTLWTRTYGGRGVDYGTSVQQTSDGGYIVAGYTYSLSTRKDFVYLIKIDSSGDTLWTKTYGDTNYYYGQDVQQTSDSGYIIVGYTYSSVTEEDIYLIKTNASGDTLWTKTYGGTGRDFGRSVRQTSDGGYIIAGSTRPLGDSGQVYLIKTDASGDTLWSRTYGGVLQDGGWSVRQSSDSSYIIAGSTRSFGNSGQVYLIKTNITGDTLWTKTYGGSNIDYGYCVQQTTDGGYIIAGETYSFGMGFDDVYLIKTDGNGNVGVEVSPNRESRVASYGIFPNPFSSVAAVPGHSSESFALYDISGRKVGTYKGDRIGAGLSAGVYFLKPEARDSKLLRVVKVR